MFAKASEVTTIRPAPDPTPFSQSQLDAAEKTAAAAVKAAVYAGRAAGWLAVPELEPERTLIRP